MAPILLADNIGPGGTAFFIVLALIVAALVIFWAMFGSLRRLKQSVARGAFGETEQQAEADAAAATRAAGGSATRDPGGRGGAGA